MRYWTLAVMNGSDVTLLPANKILPKYILIVGYVIFAQNRTVNNYIYMLSDICIETPC